MNPLLATMPLWVYQHVPTAVFVFCFGACVGSFMNVVVHRLPAGGSVISPPSRCPTCGAMLGWRENLPIIGWLLLRGKCKHCGVSISAQYVLVELLMAVLFLGLYILLFVVQPTSPWWGQVGGAWWFHNGLFRLPFPAGAWPSFIAWSFLLAGLVGMTLIDARTFMIPLRIPLVVTVTAFAAYAVQGMLPQPHAVGRLWPIPAPCWQGLALCGGAAGGLVVSYVLLKAGVLRYSFADYQQYVNEGETLGDYPHARREMVWEILYLLPCMLGMALAWFLRDQLPTSRPPLVLQAIGGAVLGYLVGGGLVWATRVLGTLGFGREAMGLGDVHLMGAVGAVLGWQAALWTFFIAPFSGLAWVAVGTGLSAALKRAKRELPYGPHLAVAALIVIVCRPGLATAWTAITGQPYPASTLCGP